MKKLLSILIAICMIMQILPVFAQDAITQTADTYGFIFNDTFDDGTAQGWAAGVVQSSIQSTVVTPTTLPTGENVLKAEFTGASYGTAWDTLYEPNVFKETDLVAFNGDNLIRIKARVKNALNYDIKVNRPDACGWGQLSLRSSCYHHHAVAGLNDEGKPTYGIGVSSAVSANDYKNMSALKNADGSEFDYTGVDFSDKWIDYTVVINGATNEQTVTASFEHNGETVTVYSGSNSTFAQPPATYSYAGREGESTFAGFERLTFSSVAIGTPSTIYIDSVSVENILVKSTTATIEKEAIKPTNSVVVNFSGDIDLPEGAVTVEGAEVTQSFDAATGALTITPVDAFESGKTYNITVDSELLAENFITYENEAPLSFCTTGYVFNDNFNDGTAQGWEAGYGNAVTVTPVDGVLKVDMPKGVIVGSINDNDTQSILTKGANVKFTGDNLIRIKAKVKNTEADGKYAIKVNRPNSGGWSMPFRTEQFWGYSVAGLDTTPKYGNGISDAGGLTKAYKNMSAVNVKPDGSTFDYTGVDLTGKWLDYTVVINGATNEQWVTVSFEHNGETVTLVNGGGSTFEQPHAAYSNDTLTFDAFERLSFVLQSTESDETLYIDDVSVENIVVEDVEFTYTGKDAVKNGDELTFAVTTDADTIPANIVKINGTAAEASYDADNKVLTVVADNITAGENTITIDADVLSQCDLNVVGNTTFTVMGAVGLGYIFNDNFDDGTLQGWAGGEGTTVGLEAVTLETGEKVLKADFVGASYGTAWDTLYEPNVFKETTTVPFDGDNLIRIKARVKNALNYDIKVNRPNASGWGQLSLRSSCYHHHAVAGFNDEGKPTYGIGVSSAVSANDYKNMSALKNADGSEFDYSGINLADKWIDYTVVINGATNEQIVTASFEHNGETVTVYSGSNSTFAQPPATYSYAGREGESTFAGFERLTFSSVAIGTPSTIYIDSVSVENIVIEDIEFAYTGKTNVKNGDELTFAVTTEAETIPANIVTINGTAAEATYDADNKVLTVVADNIVGGSNTITIDSAILESRDFFVKGETTFNVNGLGYVLNDNFNDGTAQGWVVGHGNAVTVTPENGMLKVDMPKGVIVGSINDNDTQSILTKGANVKFTGDNLIRIKAKVKNTEADGSYAIKVNRPNSGGWSMPFRTEQFWGYSVAGLDTTPKYGNGVSTAGGLTNGYKNMSTVNVKPDGSTFDYTGVDLTGKWLDYTVVINGATNEQWVTVSFEHNGETVTLVNGGGSTFIQPHAAYSNDTLTFDAFERLSFVLQSTASDETLYIDDVSVENILTEDISFEYTGKSTVNSGEELTFAVTTEATNLPENFVTVNGVVAEASYDADNKVLTVAGDNIKGGNNTILIAARILTGNGFNVTGETTFNVNGLGYIFNDNFNDGTAQGWVVGHGNAVTVTPENGMLKVDMPKGVIVGSWTDNDTQSVITKGAETVKFTGDNLIRIKAKVKNTEADGNYALKVNRPNSGYQTMPFRTEQFWGYGVAGLDEAPVYGQGVSTAGGLTNGYKNKNKVRVKPDGTTFDYTGVDFTGKWVDYTVVINGATNEQWVTVSFEHNGETITLVNGGNSTFEQPHDAYSKAGRGGELTFEGFERLSFVLQSTESDETLYIDDVSVENISYETISAEYISDTLLDTTDSVLIKLDGNITSVPEGAVAIEGVEVTQSFNPETSTLSLTPVTEFKGGVTNKVVINVPLLMTYGYKVEGETTFNFTTTGFAFNDTFDDGTLQGWSAGVGGSATLEPVTLETGEKVLKADLGASGYGTQWANLYESNVFKESVDMIDFTGNNIVRIKAKIKNASPYMIKVNRPNSSGYGQLPLLSSNYNHYMVAGYDNGKPTFGSDLTYVAGNSQWWKYPHEFTYNSDGKLFDYTDVDLSDKWIEYTVVINGATNEQTVTATFEHNGETVTLLSDESSTFIQPSDVYYYAGRAGETTFAGFERLTIASRDFGAASTLYIDSVSVENIKINEAPETAITYLVNDVADNSFRNGDVIKPQFVLNAGGVQKSYTVISALYVDGQLDDMHVDYVTTEGIVTYTDKVGYTISADDISQYQFKAFVWAGGDGFTTLKPISKTAYLKPDLFNLEDGLSVYVQSNGSDEIGTGVVTDPVATLDKALEVVKSKKARGFDGEAVVVLGEGNYDIASTVTVTDEYVPQGGLTIKAQSGEKAVLNGGISYNLSDAVKVEDEAILGRLYSDNAKENLYVIDLTTKMAIKDIPAVNYPGTYNLNSMLSKTELESPSSYATLVSLDDELMTIARYPNSGYTAMGSIVDGGIEARYMEKEYDGSENDLDVTRENLLKGFSFNHNYANAANWATADQALIFGYFMYDWATQTVPLKEVSVSGSTATISSKYPSYYGAKEGGRFYVYNLLEEIDVEGEYFLDRNTGKLYFYMPQNAKADSKITIANRYETILSINDTANVTVDSIAFTMTKADAINVSNSSNVVVSNCEISNIANMAVNVSGENNIVENCYIHDVNGGITLNSTNNEEAVNTMTASNNKAINNEIENFSIINKTYTPAITLYGAGNQALNNELHDSEHMAIRYGGYGHLIKENEVYDVCKEVDDSGAVYVGRNWTNRGTQIVNNYFHDINSTISSTNTVAGIFLDDHFAGANIEGNVFANIGGDGIRGNGGREHVITNNIFVNCSERSVYMPDNNYTAATASQRYSAQISGASEFIGNSLWEAKYPLMFTVNYKGQKVVNINEMREPSRHTFTNNLCVKAPYYYGERATKKATAISGNYTTNTDPGFSNMANGDYSIAESVVKALIPQFKAIDFSKIGRY